MSVLAPTLVGRHRAAEPVRAPRAIRPAAAGHAPSRRAPGGPGRGARRIARVATNVAVGLALLAFLGLALGPHVFGYRTATMLTGSMEPMISPGDVVVTAPKPAADLAVGDVVTYQIPIEDRRVETHRVTEVARDAAGVVSFRTQGDANANVDPWTAVVDGDTVWEVQAVVPRVGLVIQAMRAPVVQHGVLWIALVACLLLGLQRIWGISPGSEEQDDETSGASRTRA
ncbi:signal peptidase I [Nocardioides pantholopis]|uniref:signal peptidase I n=1 Tax=Nocardioides pantholopis TaxID=2483798 RepID=UPI0019D158F6|nr:signal peptidase I [Nocardioides pantholopis]